MTKTNIGGTLDIIDIRGNLKCFQSEIDALSKQFNHQKIKLIAVSKTKPISAIESAYECGHQDFGENYAPELAKKAEELNNLAINWHYIGQIQSNKTKQIAKYSHWVHSLSSFKIANRLNNHCEELNKKLNILIQINLLNEKNKSGIEIEKLNDFIDQVIEMKNLHLRGFMFIPPIDLNSQQLKETFSRIQSINKDLQKKYPNQQLDTLSYGMSADWKIAIQSGSNCIRIGTAIFGKR